MPNVDYLPNGNILIAERGEYRVIYIPDDLGMKYRVQKMRRGAWKTVYYAGTSGECFIYINKANYGKEN